MIAFLIQVAVILFFALYLLPRLTLKQRAKFHVHRAQSRPVLAAVVKLPSSHAVQALRHTPQKGVAQLHCD